MTFKEKIMKLQTYKMFVGEDTVYVERDDILKLLEQEPKTGHWIAYHYGAYYVCSTCKGRNNSRYAKYCPNCGAKMIESQESEN